MLVSDCHSTPFMDGIPTNLSLTKIAAKTFLKMDQVAKGPALRQCHAMRIIRLHQHAGTVIIVVNFHVTIRKRHMTPLHPLGSIV